MDELLIQGQWWWLLVVPVATGVFALGGSWLGSRFGRTTEHTQWLRNQKQTIYTDFLLHALSMSKVLGRDADVSHFEEKLFELATQIKVIGATPVYNLALRSYVLIEGFIKTPFEEESHGQIDTLSHEISVLLNELSESMRADLGAKD